MESPPRDPPLSPDAAPFDRLVEDLRETGPDDFPAAWRALGRHGVLRRFAGAGLSEGCRLLEALGHHLDHIGIFISIISGCGLAIPILEAAADLSADTPARALRDRVLAGEIVLGVAITERGAGSDVLGMETTLRERGGRLLLRGDKWSVTNAPAADRLIVFCQSHAGGQRFLTAVLLPCDAPGVERSPARALVGARGSPTGEIVLRDVEVDPAWILGRRSDGKRLLELAFVRERLLAPWPLLGKMGRVLQEALDHIEHRRQFGQALKAFQHVQEKIVASFERLATSKLLAERALLAHERGEPCQAHASLAKYHAAESAAQVFKAMIEVHGSYGVLEEARLGEYLADALCASIAGGTREIHKKVVFDELVLDRARARRLGRSSYFALAAPGRSPRG